jgi:transcriptional regulator with XRE-family HTH domain
MATQAPAKPRSAAPAMPGGTFGANLKTAREHAGLSREVLGERAGLNAATIYRLEGGSRQPRLPTIIALGEVLGMTASELVANL